MEGKLIILVVITFQAGNAITDPCEVHQNITDVDLLTTHTFKEGQTCDYTPSAITPAWYRYIATPAGAMATSCPSNTSCGGKEQIWVNDTLPSYAAGITSVAMCVSTAKKCCDIKNTILMKNCNSFYVVQLGKPTKCFTHYCFDSAITKLVTVLTTQSTSTTTTEMTTTSTSSTMIYTTLTTESTSIQTTTLASIQTTTPTSIQIATPTSTQATTPTSIQTTTPTSIQTTTPTSIKTTTPTSIQTTTPTSIQTTTPTSTQTTTPTSIETPDTSTISSKLSTLTTESTSTQATTPTSIQTTTPTSIQTTTPTSIKTTTPTSIQTTTPTSIHTTTPTSTQTTTPTSIQTTTPTSIQTTTPTSTQTTTPTSIQTTTPTSIQTTTPTSIQTTTPTSIETPDTSTISSKLSELNNSHPTILENSATVATATTENKTASITYLPYSSTSLTSHLTETHTTIVISNLSAISQNTTDRNVVGNSSVGYTVSEAKLIQNEIDKDKGKTTALAAGLGTAGAIIIMASIFTVLFVLHRKMRLNKNAIIPVKICPEK